MAKIIENDARLPKWLNAVLNRAPFCIDADRVRTVWGYVSDLEGARRVTDFEGDSLYLNGVWFIRLTAPFGVFLGLKPVVNGRIYHAGIGWKGNGRFTVTLRRQTFEQSERGVLGPNFGHARGWERGNA